MERTKSDCGTLSRNHAALASKVIQDTQTAIMRRSMPETVETVERGQRPEGTAGGCPVQMFVGAPCTRPLYPSPPGIDERPVCLMHSRDPNKDNKAFQEEIERILEEAGEGIADFIRFVFPEARFAGRKFIPRCSFFRATFTQDADFFGATFGQDAVFFGATFTQRANFIGATFTQDAYFIGATFTHRADFSGATFTQRAYFSEATFGQDADFFEATFGQDADFSGATFTQRANFIVAIFTQDAYFIGATFTQRAYFIGATFTQDANFSVAIFTQGAGFSDATFTHRADFSGATFGGDALFRETKFRNDGQDIGPTFSRTRFERPERAEFYQTNLRQALFYNCDVSKLVFSNVEWRKRDNGKRMVFEEVVSLEHAAAEALKPPEESADERNYSLIAELYQQLKKNFDDRRDYWTAGDFHYGEMEMKRLSSGRQRVQRSGGLPGRWLGRVLGGRSITVAARIDWAKSWLHRHLGLVAWYKYASEYGESYRRPAVWLGIILLLFMLAYPIAGLERADGIPTPELTQSLPKALSQISYENFFQFQAVHPKGAWWGAAAFFGHSLLTALSVMALQRDVIQALSYPGGRVLALMELLLTSTLIALFLLAVRRQFRR